MLNTALLSLVHRRLCTGGMVVFTAAASGAPPTSLWASTADLQIPSAGAGLGSLSAHRKAAFLEVCGMLVGGSCHRY